MIVRNENKSCKKIEASARNYLRVLCFFHEPRYASVHVRPPVAVDVLTKYVEADWPTHLHQVNIKTQKKKNIKTHEISHMFSSQRTMTSSRHLTHLQVVELALGHQFAGH
jgi:hypothetical protein